VRIFSTETGELLREIKKHTDWIYAVKYSPDGVLLATADRSNGLFVWEAATAREYLNLQGHKEAVCDVSWRPDSNVLASASMDGTVKLWEMNEGKNPKSWTAHGGGVSCINYTHDGRIVTAGRDKTAKAWSGDGNLLKQFPAFAEIALQATFTHDGQRVVAGDWAGQVRMWQTADAQPLAELTPNPPTLQVLLDGN
jgi:WD40 repeat protein